MDSTCGLITCKALKHHIDPHCIIFQTDKALLFRGALPQSSPSRHLRGLYWTSRVLDWNSMPWLFRLNDLALHTDRTAECRAASLVERENSTSQSPRSWGILGQHSTGDSSGNQACRATPLPRSGPRPLHDESAGGVHPAISLWSFCLCNGRPFSLR